MPAAAIAVPLIIGAVEGGSAIASAKMGANASKKASQVQVDASNKAMDYQRQQQQQAMQYAERMRTMPMQGPQPGGAQSYLSHLMRIPGGNAPSGAPPMASSAGYQFQPAMGAAASGSGAGQNLGYAGLMGGQAQGGGMVMMQGPDGDQRAIPQEQVAHYLSIPGFKRIGA